MGSTAEQWTLEFLLDQDGLSEGAVRELYEHLSGGGEPLSKTIQARLLLRVLREHAANISEATLNALNCLAATSSDIKSHYSPHANLQNLLPSLDLYLLAKTELVLQTLRGGPVHEILQSGAPIHALNRFFAVPDPSNRGAAPEIPEAEAQRRDELAIGLTTPEGAEALLEKYTRETVEHAMQAYVNEGRQAMGPAYLKTVELHVAQGLYDPYAADGIYAQDRFKRQRVGMTGSNADVAAAATITDLQAASKALQGKGGMDPFPAAMQAAGAHMGYPGAVHPDGTPVNMPEGMLARTLAWDSPGDGQAIGPDGLPRQDLAMIGPDGQPLTGDASMGGKTPKNRAGGGKRRRNGRWSPQETNQLINLVRQFGKGKWKKILEEGGPVFNNRSQVDLKDKWRNLERQGVVGPADSGPAALGAGAQQPQQQPDGSVMPPDRQQALDVQHLEHQQQLAQQQLEQQQQQQQQHMMEHQHHHHAQQHHMMQHDQHGQPHMGHEQPPQHGDGSEMLAMEGHAGHDMGGLPDGVAGQPVNIPVMQ